MLVNAENGPTNLVIVIRLPISDVDSAFSDGRCYSRRSQHVAGGWFERRSLRRRLELDRRLRRSFRWEMAQLLRSQILQSQAGSQTSVPMLGYQSFKQLTQWRMDQYEKYQTVGKSVMSCTSFSSFFFIFIKLVVWWGMLFCFHEKYVLSKWKRKKKYYIAMSFWKCSWYYE